MGRFYTNVVIKGVSKSRLIETMQSLGRDGYVSPVMNGLTVIYDAKCEDGDPGVVRALARKLSKALNCVAWGVLNHDDDVLMYFLCNKGRLVDTYNSAPDYFNDDAVTDGEASPAGGNAVLLASCFEKPETAKQIEKVLRQSADDDEDFLFAAWRHERLAKILGIRTAMISIGYEDLSEGVDRRLVKLMTHVSRIARRRTRSKK